MKKIISKLNEISQLLSKCGWPEKANWFHEESMALNKTNLLETKQHLNNIKNILVGMGSFSDLPLVPAPDSNLTKENVKKSQWELTEELDTLINEFFEKNVHKNDRPNIKQ